MTINMKDTVTLDQFLEVAKEKGANQQYIDKIPSFLERRDVHESIKDIANFSGEPIESIASKQVARYLNIENQEMPPLTLDMSLES